MEKLADNMRWLWQTDCENDMLASQPSGQQGLQCRTTKTKGVQVVQTHRQTGVVKQIYLPTTTSIAFQ